MRPKPGPRVPSWSRLSRVDYEKKRQRSFSAESPVEQRGGAVRFTLPGVGR